jgi:hypothetical protein
VAGEQPAKGILQPLAEMGAALRRELPSPAPRNGRQVAARNEKPPRGSIVKPRDPGDGVKDERTLKMGGARSAERRNQARLGAARHGRARENGDGWA